MKKMALCLMLIFVVLLIGCENVDVSKLSDTDLERISDKLVVCEEPYMRFGTSCCLDKNNNQICDKDEESIQTEKKTETEKQDEVIEEEPPEQEAEEEFEYSENSEEWQNVYSRALYYSIKNETVTDLFKNEYNNIYYAKKLSVDNFIIINTKDSYDAISVAPYAVLTKAYVLFSDEKSIDSVLNFLNSRTVNSIILYGNIDESAKQKLSKFNPQIISLNGKFENNIEIVKEYRKINPVKQIILTNGEFIEREIMSGVEPVLFIGAQNVPEAVQNYIKESDINIGILIGNDLIGTATFIRRQLGISVFVKFAEGARGRDSSVESRDLYNLPVYNALLEIKSIEFDESTNQIKVTFSNPTDDTEYLKGTYTLTGSDGAKQTVGDIDTELIDKNDLKIVTYTVESLPEEDIKVEAYVIYGTSEGSLEKEIREAFCSTCDRQVE